MNFIHIFITSFKKKNIWKFHDNIKKLLILPQADILKRNEKEIMEEINSFNEMSAKM